jgi:hypothetical protein
MTMRKIQYVTFVITYFIFFERNFEKRSIMCATDELVSVEMRCFLITKERGGERVILCVVVEFWCIDCWESGGWNWW